MTSKRSIESYATLPRSRSSGGIKNKPIDEGSALINLTKQVSAVVVLDTAKRYQQGKVQFCAGLWGRDVVCQAHVCVYVYDLVSDSVWGVMFIH